jgi:AcrR family transcriptional regulator
LNLELQIENSSPWMTFEDRRRARDAKKDAVLCAAVRLFLEEGYHRATLNEVAKRLKITKPALYNYFRSKEEIFFECYQIGQELIEKSIAEIEAEKGNGLDKLRKLAHAYARAMMTDFGMCLVRLDDRELTPDKQKIVRRAKKRIDRAFRRLISTGIADGSISDCDPKLAAFALAGSLNWIGHWYMPDGKLPSELIAEAITQILIRGLSGDKPPKRGSSSLFGGHV